MQVRDSKKWIGFLGLIGLAFLGVLLVLIFKSVIGGIKQPLPFSHRIHTANGLECNDCHRNFLTQPSSGRPVLETCSECHNENQAATESGKKLLGYIKSGEEIPWRRIYRLPPDVYFSHRIHVVVASIECQVCHGNIGQSDTPPAKPLEISMKKCLSCHRKRGVTNDCLSCHR